MEQFRLPSRSSWVVPRSRSRVCSMRRRRKGSTSCATSSSARRSSEVWPRHAAVRGGFLGWNSWEIHGKSMVELDFMVKRSETVGNIYCSCNFSWEINGKFYAELWEINGKLWEFVGWNRVKLWKSMGNQWEFIVNRLRFRNMVEKNLGNREKNWKAGGNLRRFNDG